MSGGDQVSLLGSFSVSSHQTQAFPKNSVPYPNKHRDVHPTDVQPCRQPWALAAAEADLGMWWETSALRETKASSVLCNKCFIHSIPVSGSPSPQAAPGLQKFVAQGGHSSIFCLCCTLFKEISAWALGTRLCQRK